MARKRRRSYPRYGQDRKDQVSKRWSIERRTCNQCGRVAQPGETMIAVDIQWDWFRGNDDVARFCTGCNAHPMPAQQMGKKLWKAEQATS